MSRFSAAASSYAAIVGTAAIDENQKVEAFAQVLAAAVYQSNPDWNDKEKAEFLLKILNKTFAYLPALEYEFELARQEATPNE